MKKEIKNKIFKFIGCPTINRFYELEKCKITPFVENGVKYIIMKTLNLKVLDSNNESFSSDRYNDEMTVKIYSTIEFVKDKKIKDIIDLGDKLKIKVLEDKLNISSSKILYVEINKKLLKWT